MNTFRVGDFVRIKDLPSILYPITHMKRHAGREGRITGFLNHRAVLCIDTGYVWKPCLLEKVGD